jgi:hypothetical protein
MRPGRVNAKLVTGMPVLIAALALATGCRVDRKPMDAAHAARVSAIDHEFDRKLTDNARQWDELKRQVLERRRYLVPLDGDGLPARRVSDGLREEWEVCEVARLVVVEEACKAEVRERLWDRLVHRYFRVDFDVIRRELMSHPAGLDLEALACRSHNERLSAEIDSAVAEIDRHKAEFRDAINEYRRERIVQSGRQRDREIEVADEERRAIWAAAIQGFANGVQSGTQASATTSSGLGPDPRTACTSDYSCEFGQTCVKDLGRTTGTCLRAVNEYGNQSFEGPDPRSIGPRLIDENACTVSKPCPIGFRCDPGSGRCIK